MGGPLHIPDDETRKTVRDLVLLGHNHDQISAELGISRQTLAKYYPEELKHRQRKLCDIAKSIYQRAADDERRETALTIFLMKSQAGWHEIRPDEALTTDLTDLIKSDPAKALEYLDRLRSEAMHAAAQARDDDAEE